MFKSEFYLAFVVLVGLGLYACGAPAAPTSAPATHAAVPTQASVRATSIVQPSAQPAAAMGPRVLRIGATTFPDVLDPQKSSFVTEINILQLAYEGLVRIDEKGKVQPGAAEQWESAADGKSMTFHLRDGLKRSDDTPMSCADFEYALKREVDPFTTGRAYVGIVFDIKGAKELDDYAATTAADQLEKAQVDALYQNLGVRCLDERTLQVDFVDSVGFWQYIASTWVTYPTDRRAIEKDGATWWTKAENHVGNGPFRISAIEEHKRVVLEANPNYWGGRPKLDRIEFVFNPNNQTLFDAYKKGELDLIAALPEWLSEIQSAPSLQSTLISYPAASTTAFAFNNTRRPFDDRNVRIAFSQIIDREGYSRDINKGTTKPYTRWIPPGVPGAQPEQPGVPATDIQAGVKTLVESGYAAADSTPENPKVDCAKLGELKITYPSSPAEHSRAAYLANNINLAIGCPVMLEPVDPTVFTSLTKDVRTNPQISRLGWLGDYPHPQNWLSAYWKCGGFSKNYGYCNLKLDELLNEADQTLDLEQAMKKYQEAEELLLSDVPGAIAYYNQNMFLVAPYLSGPRDYPSANDGIWIGSYGPLLQYDIDLTRVPSNYPRQ